MGMARRTAALYLVRPYVRRELPGWSTLYQTVVGPRSREGDWHGLELREAKGKLHGYDMQFDLSNRADRASYFLGRSHDLPVQLLLMAVLKPGDTFVDIGANEAMTSLLAARLVGPRGRVIAFEPNPVPRRRVQWAADRNRINGMDIRACGLGDTDSMVDLIVPGFDAEDLSTRVRCPIRVGDRELAHAKPRLIRIGVEGFEEAVLRGLAATIARTRPLIVMEMSGRHLQWAGSSIAALLNILTAHRYRGWQLDTEGPTRARRLAYVTVDFLPDFRGEVVWVPEGDPFLAHVLS
jgi:FkbM family methyltransferase